MPSYLEIYCFYLVAGVFLSVFFATSLKSCIRGALVSLMIIFVSSEFWEIPLFCCAYLGFPGYGSPEVLHHISVLCVAAALFFFLNKRFSVPGAVLLLCDLFFNFLFLLIYPGVISGWILRSLSLISLSLFVFLTLRKK